MAEQEALVEISGRDLIKKFKDRQIIPLTLSADIALGGGIPLGCTVLIGGPEKMGKAVAMDSRLLTKNGWILMKDVKQGHMICGTDGNFYQVIGVYPQGKKKCYRVWMSDETYVDASEDHLWYTQTIADLACDRKGSVKTTRFIIDTLNIGVDSKGYDRTNHFLPMVQPIQFSKKDLDLDPYVLGCLLGDGGLTDTTVNFTNTDEDILTKLASRLPKSDFIKQISSTITYRVHNKEKGTVSSTKTILKDLGLMGKYSNSKFIPEEYKFSSIEDRIELLKGLVDTNGSHVGKNLFEICTVSKVLSEDIAFIVRSLGGRCTINDKNGNRVPCQDAYRIIVSFTNGIVPCSCSRKLENYEAPTRRELQSIKRVEDLREVECQCISVDSPDRLFVVNDFVLTHNTSLCLQYAANAQELFGCEVFYFPGEGRLTNKVIEQIRGLNLDKLTYFDPSKKVTAEQWWAMIGKIIESKTRAVIIVDSIANFSSEKELSEGMGFQGRGDKNKLEAQFCRTFGDMIIKNKITIFLMTQIQANTSGYGAPTQLKVGNQIKFQADIIMLGKRAEKWKPSGTNKDGDGGRILGQDCVYTIQESALGPPHVEAKIPLRYGYGIDNLLDLFTQAINWGLIEQKNAWYTLPFVEDDKGNIKYTPLVNATTKEGEETENEAKKDKKEKKEKKEAGYIRANGEAAGRNWLLLHPDEAKILENEIRKQVFG